MLVTAICGQYLNVNKTSNYSSKRQFGSSRFKWLKSTLRTLRTTVFNAVQIAKMDLFGNSINKLPSEVAIIEELFALKFVHHN